MHSIHFELWAFVVKVRDIDNPGQNVCDKVPFSRIAAIFARSPLHPRCNVGRLVGKPFLTNNITWGEGGKVGFGPKNVCFHVKNWSMVEAVHSATLSHIILARIVESPTYPKSDVGTSPRSKQPLHSCNIIFPCSLKEFPFSVLWETIKLLRGLHSDLTGRDALPRSQWLWGKLIGVFQQWQGGGSEKRCNVCSDVGEFKRNKLLLCKCDIGLCAAPFFEEPTTILDILAHFDILLMLLTVFKYSNLAFTKYILATYIHEM